MSQLSKVQFRWKFRLVTLLVTFGMGLLHIPVSTSRLPEKDLSERFPCENRPCGCRSAAQCWKECCCFSNAQKIAWAKSNNVTTPAFVAVAAARESQLRNLTTNTCCKSTASCQDSAKFTQLPKSRRARSSRYVIGIFAQKCRGDGLFWQGMPWFIIQTIALEFYADSNRMTVTRESEHCQVVSYRPPLPPPRHA